MWKSCKSPTKIIWAVTKEVSKRLDDISPTLHSNFLGKLSHYLSKSAVKTSIENEKIFAKIQTEQLWQYHLRLKLSA